MRKLIYSSIILAFSAVHSDAGASHSMKEFLASTSGPTWFEGQIEPKPLTAYYASGNMGAHQVVIRPLPGNQISRRVSGGSFHYQEIGFLNGFSNITVGAKVIYPSVELKSDAFPISEATQIGLRVQTQIIGLIGNSTTLCRFSGEASASTVAAGAEGRVREFDCDVAGHAYMLKSDGGRESETDTRSQYVIGYFQDYGMFLIISADGRNSSPQLKLVRIKSD